MPRTPHFTERNVDDAKPGRHKVSDTDRLYLYVSPKGVRRYFLRYTVPGQRRVTETSVGKPGIDLERAKSIAAKFNELLRDGIDRRK
jgi:hypothetical protein